MVAILAIALSACGTPPSPSVAPPTPSPSSPATLTYDDIEKQVAAMRGLNPTKTVVRKVIDEAELRSIFTELFDKETPPEYLAANERLYKALGLMPQDGDLRDLSLDLLSGGVAGFYREDEGQLYVVSRSGELGGNELVTFAHEFDHALQDQNFPVFKDQKDVLDRTDWILARKAVSEGDATLLMTLWMIGHLSMDQLKEVVAAGSDPQQAALLERMPAIMSETLMFPYTTGATFVQAIHSTDGWPGVDRMYDRLPESTEQILHSEKYEAAEAPIAVDLPDDLAARLGSGWSVPLEDTFGELQTGIWLREGGVERAAADAAAAGWGGDRLAVVDGPGDSWALAWQTAWDTPADAAAFETAASTALGSAQGSARVFPGEGDSTRWIVIADGDDTLGRVANVLGLAG